MTFLRKIIPVSVFKICQPAYHFCLAFLAAVWYGFPARHIAVIGVTGTKGKTTVTELLHAIFLEAGIPSAALSSHAFYIKDTEIKNDKKMTMPGRFFVQKFLYDAKKAGCKFVVLEVTSEGIRQYRHRFIKFSAAVMTNVAPEHIESHGGMEPYVRAKLDLFWRVDKHGIAVINRDDSSWRRFAAATPAKKIFYSGDRFDFGGKVISIKNAEIGGRATSFEADVAVTSPMLGEFNLYNLLASFAAAHALHVNPEKIASALEKFAGVSGRMEYIAREPFRVVVDYAHTPDSLRAVYGFLKKDSRKLICVFGAAGGGRDKWKRLDFGSIAAEFCDEIILTNEDPYDEDPKEIMEQIVLGIPHAFNREKLHRMIDRREAIQEALKKAAAGDTVVVTGKGSEPWIMGPGGSKIPWSDREEVKKILNNQ